MKNVIKQCILSILLPSLRTAVKSSARGPIGGDRRSQPQLSDESYQVRFIRVSVGSEAYLVPSYAMHRPACRAIVSGHYYEPRTHELVKALLEDRAGDMIHAGAFFGDMLPSFSRKCPGTVYAFEPVLENYLLAKLCVQENDLANVVLWNAGLGRALSVAHIDTGEDGLHSGGSAQIRDTGQLTSLVPLNLLGLRDVSVIHLDVEGFELEALTGAVQTIRACKPTVLIEDRASNCAPLLAGEGYTFVGSIPGLKAWAQEQQAARVKAILREL
jgi:FkbM family methyltransferase